MNLVPAESLSSGPVEPPLPVAGWSRWRWFLWILVAFVAHVVLICIFGTKKQAPPRPVTNSFQLQLADGASELITLTDPTLFVLPHAGDFASAVWLRPPAIATPSFHWVEPACWLPLAAENLGAHFQQFVRTNQFEPAPFQLDFKPVPRLLELDSTLPSPFPPTSTFQIRGELAQRRLLNQIHVPSLPVNDVLPPTRVQALVDAAGNVASVVLLETSGFELADTSALALARTAHFAPAARLTFGELIFDWHTVPVATTNAPGNP